MHTRQVLVTLQYSARALAISGAGVEVFAWAPQQIRAQQMSPRAVLMLSVTGWASLQDSRPRYIRYLLVAEGTTKEDCLGYIYTLAPDLHSGNHSRSASSCLIAMQSLARGPSVRATNIRPHGGLPRPSLAHAAPRQAIGGLIARPSLARDLLKHQVCNIAS